MTAPITADVVTRAGSLTDGGKKVFLSKEEVDIAASMSAEVLVEGGMGLRAGDRVADVMERRFMFMFMFLNYSVLIAYLSYSRKKSRRKGRKKEPHTTYFPNNHFQIS